MIPSFPCIAPGLEGWGHNPRKGSDPILQRSSGAVVLQAQRAKHIQSDNLAIAIWQPFLRGRPAAAAPRHAADQLALERPFLGARITPVVRDDTWMNEKWKGFRSKHNLSLFVTATSWRNLRDQDQVIGSDVTTLRVGLSLAIFRLFWLLTQANVGQNQLIICRNISKFSQSLCCKIFILLRGVQKLAKEEA